MADAEKLWGFIYMNDAGEKVSVRIHGSEEEALNHARNLGLQLETIGQITAMVDYEAEIVTQKGLH